MANQKQTNMGREIGVRQKQYSHIESGNVVLKLQVFLQIADILKIHPSDLLEQSGLLKDFPPCEKTNTINRLESEIAVLKTQNKLLNYISDNIPDKK